LGGGDGTGVSPATQDDDSGSVDNMQIDDDKQQKPTATITTV
jgi:hypothetical protein